MKTLIKLSFCFFMFALAACSPGGDNADSTAESKAFDAITESNIVLGYRLDTLQSETDAILATPAMEQVIVQLRNGTPLPPELESARMDFAIAVEGLINNIDQATSQQRVVAAAYIEGVYDPTQTARLVAATQALEASINEVRNTLAALQTQAELYYVPPAS